MELARTDFTRLRDALGENTRTVIPFHFLKHDGARAWADERFENAVIFTGPIKRMVFVYGDDADWQVELLGGLEWLGMYWCPTDTGEDIHRAVEAKAPVETLLEPDIQRTVHKHVHVPPPEGVELRRLSQADLPSIEAAGEELRWLCNGWQRSWEVLLDGGILVGAIIDGRMVSGAVTFARAERLDDIGVATLTEYQGGGLSSACASAIVAQILAEGRRPVWTVFCSNTPSVRVSEKLGFVTQTECVVIRERPQE